MSAAATIVYELTLTEPVSFPLGTGDPNSTDTAQYVPGGALLGALAERWLVERGVGRERRDLAVDPDFRRLFLDGSTRFLHAYPAASGQVRCVPRPLSLHRDKLTAVEGDHYGLWDLAVDDSVLADERRSLALVPMCFVDWDGGSGGRGMGRVHPRVITRMHHKRDRTKGRPVDGGIFSYRALAAGQTFIGAIELGDESDADWLKAELQKDLLRIGRSRAAGYGGGCRIRLIERKGWVEVAPPKDETPPDDHMVVTLLSDYIGRDATTGGATVRGFVADLAQALGEETHAPVRAYVSTRMIRGYVSAWRAPRPTASALAAGSVLVLPVGKQSQNARVVTLGERRAEGFGRVAINWQGYAGEPVVSLRSAVPPVAQTERTSSALTEARDQIFAQWLRERVPMRANGLEFQAGVDSLSPSAVSAMRSALSQQRAPVVGEFPEWAERNVGKKVVRAFERCPVELKNDPGQAGTLLALLAELASAQEGSDEDRARLVARIEGKDLNPPRPRFLAEASLPYSEVPVLARLLADAVLDQARRQAKEKR